MQLSHLVAKRRELVAAKAQIEEELAELNALIIEQLEGEPYADTQGTLEPVTRRTLDKKRAEVLLASVALSEEAAAEIYTTAIDPRALREYAPEVYDAACKESAPFLRETKG